jgi:hypothetical protein
MHNLDFWHCKIKEKWHRIHYKDKFAYLTVYSKSDVEKDDRATIRVVGNHYEAIRDESSGNVTIPAHGRAHGDVTPET